MSTQRRKVVVLVVMCCAALGVMLVTLFGTGSETPPEIRQAKVLPTPVVPSANILAWATLSVPPAPQPPKHPAAVRIARDPFSGGPGLTEAEWEKKQRDDEEARRRLRERAEIEVRDMSGIHVTDDMRITRTHAHERAIIPPVGRYCGYIVTSDGQALAIVENTTTGRARAVRVGEEYTARRVKAITPENLLLEDRAGNLMTLKLTEVRADQRPVVLQSE